MLKKRVAAFILSLTLVVGFAPGLAFAAEGDGLTVGATELSTQEYEWGWVSVEGGPTFYGTPQVVTVKGLTASYSGGNLGYNGNKARFSLYKDGDYLYSEDIVFTLSDWMGKVPVEWSWELTELGDYTVKFYHIYNHNDGWGWQRNGSIYEAQFTIVKPLKANPMTVKTNVVTLKASKTMKKARSIKASNAFIVKNAKGKVTYEATESITKNAMKKITVAENGKITVKKGTKAGKYKLKVKVTAAGDTAYNPKSKTVKLVVKVV